MPGPFLSCRQSSTAGVLIQQFGIAGDTPLPNAFVR